MKILALVPDAHGGFGGIAQYNRDLIDALCEFERVQQVTLLPRHVRSEPKGVPGKVTIVESASEGISAYSREVLLAARQRYDVILCSHIYLLPYAKLAAFGRHTPIVCLLYGTEAWEPTRRFLVDRLVRECEGLISISEFTKTRFCEWSGVSEERVGVLPNAIDATLYGMGAKPSYLVQRYGLAGKRVIMTLGRLDAAERQKGFDELIDLMPRLLSDFPDLVYLIAGDGDDRPRLEQKVVAAGLQGSVKFAGRVKDDEKAHHYRLCDVFSMAGRQEGFGFVFLEALATGAPVVASALDGSRNAVLDGKLGELANPDEPESLHRAIASALAKPRMIPELLGYFSFQNFVRRLDTLLARFVPAEQRPIGQVEMGKLV